jgi:hypothetical protein
VSLTVLTDASGPGRFQNLRTPRRVVRHHPAQNFGRSSSPTYSNGDFNADGSVGFDDLLVLAQDYGQTVVGVVKRRRMA